MHLPPRKPLENRTCHTPLFLQFLFRKFYLTESLTIQLEMMRNKGLQEDDIQKLHTTAPEQLTDQELLRGGASAQFLRQTFPGNTLVVGTKSIPSVSSTAKHTGSGLLQSSVT